MSHAAVVGMCVLVLPLVMVPLWHVAQDPAVTPTWSNLAPANDFVLWQVSQVCCVGMWVVGSTTFERARREPLMWQVAQSLGVPLNTPLMWHDSHLAGP